ncbi:Hypothetical predicted protein, partial [Mytilus galloprovincialis]
MYKNRPLVKPMIIVGSDGYILSVLGPYYANAHNNDASITKHLFKTNAEGIKQWIKDDDVLVVDRGFRNAQAFLESLNLKVEMPCFIKKGQKQHTTEEANSSRRITKVRWVVESANGRIKQWRFLDKVISNHFVPYIGDFVRIVSAFINCFRAPLINDFCNEEIGQTMLDKAQLGNQVQKYLLCAYENTTLALACAWREIKGLNITTSRDNGNEKQDEDKVDRFTDQSDIFPNDKQALALACAWRGVGNHFTTEIQKNSK